MKKLPKSLQNSKITFKGVRFDVRSLHLSGGAERDVVIHPGAVVILPILNDNSVVMIRNERFAVGETLWELPAGTLEPEEEPEKTAYRELIEETGYEAKKMVHLTTFYTSPGICNESMYSYVATDLSHVSQHLDPSERITIEELGWEQILKMIKNGTIHDGKTITTLLLYHAFYSQ